MALEWLVERNDPKIICHPAVVFITGQAILGSPEPSMGERVAIFSCRIFIYLGSMCRILYCQIKLLYDDIKTGAIARVWKIPVPMYLFNIQDSGNLLLMWVLVLMLIQEPILHCLAYTEQFGLFATTCMEEGRKESLGL
ncbi:Pentatricopeptide repeat-containing protein [Durusdinium trenchii]|uniref:Chloroplastic n=1 Tax=Durusdinium trenchii TaxID=1381693 RepID=A0ABP0JUN8_9DINO